MKHGKDAYGKVVSMKEYKTVTQIAGPLVFDWRNVDDRLEQAPVIESRET